MHIARPQASSTQSSLENMQSLPRY